MPDLELPEPIYRVFGLAIIAACVPMSAAALWFYSHCVRPSLAHAGGSRISFLIGFAACVGVAGSLLADSALIVATLNGNLANAHGWYGPLTVASFLVLGIAWAGWSHPTWLVRATGGPDPTIPRRYLLDWLSGRWMMARGNEQGERAAAESFLRALADRGLMQQAAEGDSAIAAFVRGFDHQKSQRQHHREAVEAELRSLAPFDRVSWVRQIRHR